jgi:UDPglucose--hexose-1-phosphate uridylyltransferase
MPANEDFSRPHRRYNPLSGEWILVSPQRTSRPWQGKVEKEPPRDMPAYDQECYLCPGNKRANGESNPNYQRTFVFDNDFSALDRAPAACARAGDPLCRYESVKGTCRVICYSPRHDLTMPEMDEADIVNIVETWVDEHAKLSRIYKWVQFFENKGDTMGCSNPHPHGQVWALDSLTTMAEKEDFHQREYFAARKSLLLLDCLDREIKSGERVVVENDHWAVLVPFWAVWPYEVILVPKRHVPAISELDAGEKTALAKILKNLTVRYDNLMQTSFPYCMGWHSAPAGEEARKYWQLHAHFFPPLLRSVTIKKFMVGFEMLSEPQRDITPEQAAAKLREVPDIHYKKRQGNSDG